NPRHATRCSSRDHIERTEQSGALSWSSRKSFTGATCAAEPESVTQQPADWNRLGLWKGASLCGDYGLRLCFSFWFWPQWPRLPQNFQPQIKTRPLNDVIFHPV